MATINQMVREFQVALQAPAGNGPSIDRSNAAPLSLEELYEIRLTLEFLRDELNNAQAIGFRHTMRCPDELNDRAIDALQRLTHALGPEVALRGYAALGWKAGA